MEKVYSSMRHGGIKSLNRNTYPADILDITIILFTAFLITFILYFTLLLPSLPETAAKMYVGYLSGKEYEKASLFLINIPDGMTDTRKIITALKDTYGDCDSISIKNLYIPASSRTCNVTVDMDKDGNCYENSILLYNSKDSIFHFKKEWKVVCPFEVGNVTFKGIDGCRVFMDDEELGSIKKGKLPANGIICCNHHFRFKLDGIGESDDAKIAVNKETGELELDIVPYDEFVDSMQKVISSFCSGWEQYCLSMKSDSIKPYLTEKIYKEYIGDKSRFNGSKYTICQGTAAFKDMEIENSSSIYYTVDERWHTKEIITDRTLVFRDNKKAQLDQVQYLTWKYHIIKDAGLWKIDSADQLSYRQEILNP